MQPSDIVARYTLVKHSWRGKYTRVFCVARSGIATIDPTSIFKETNTWGYNMVVDVQPKSDSPNEVNLIVRKQPGASATETMTFAALSQFERAEFLTDVQKFRGKFDPSWGQAQAQRFTFTGLKYTSQEEWVSATLCVTNHSVDQLDRTGLNVIGSYSLQHIRGFAKCADDADALIVKYTNADKLHMYRVEGGPDAVIRAAIDHGVRYLGMPPIPTLPPMTLNEFDLHRLGVQRDMLAPTAEFPVMKLAARHDYAPVKRIFTTTETHVVERDPGTYNSRLCFALSNIASLIRCEDDAQKLMVEYRDPHVIKVYTSPARDALLAHVHDAARRSGNSNVAILSKAHDRGKRAGPLISAITEEIESTLLRCLMDPSKGGHPTGMPFNEVVEFFNANVEYNGLRYSENKDGFFAENREKLIFGAVQALLDNFPRTEDPHILLQQFYALRRLCVTRVGFSSAAIVPTLVKSIGAAAVVALRVNNTAVSHAVIDFLNTLMTPMHEFYNPYHEQINKHRMLSSDGFVRHLLLVLKQHIEQDSGALVIASLLEFLVYALCPPYSETTDSDTFNDILALVADIVGKPLFALFGHQCKAIRQRAGMLIRVIAEEGSEEHFMGLQRAALSEAGFLRQFHIAAFNNDRELRDLARRLIGYFTFDNQPAQDLLRRMVPVTLLHFLQSQDVPPEDEREAATTVQHMAQTQEWLDQKNSWFKKKFNPKDALAKANPDAAAAMDETVIYRQRNVQVQPTLNWNMFFYNLKINHLRPDLIWSHSTRTELREAIESEMQAYKAGLELKKEAAVSWNYQEFEVQYPSLADELKVGIHYPRLLFESKDPVIARPKEFFNDMYHRFLLVQDFNMRIRCLHGMGLLYQHYPEEIGQFNDIEFLIKMLEKADHPLFRDRMLFFFSQMLRARLNVKPFIDANGVRPLVELLPLCHLHVDRPQIHNNTMAIEGSGNVVDIQDQEREWHYANADGEKQEPVSYAELRRMFRDGKIRGDTKVWAQGQAGWKVMADVPQLRWGIVTGDVAGAWNLSEVTTNVLDILTLLCAYFPTRDEDGVIMQPLPRVKRYLSDPSVLPHVVQLLLTFDPEICNRTCRLLYVLMEDNPYMPRLHLTGCFFFMMMYAGSDIIPMCRFLNMAHRKQAFRFKHDNEIIQSSILSPMLPPAMVCVLANHGAAKFAEIFLGEFETPEAIWGKDMRRYLIEKIAGHISDFTPRLLGNIRATYQYCPIVGVEYDVLRNELFCSQYYLRHLCDEAKFPKWPIADPIALMRDILTAWKLELDKKPNPLNRDKCLETLEISDANPTASQVRKAYFKLAAVYHPDKNPNGRDMFEAIQAAYEFLVSDTVDTGAPDEKRIYLVLKAQSILFKYYADEMRSYKYAGYSLLLILIAREIEDKDAFNKDVCLLDPAVELCYYTVDNAPLNADELLEEGGLELCSTVLNRCMELVTPLSTDSDVKARVAMNALKTFRVSARFEDCLHRIFTMPTVPVHSTRAISFEKAPGLARAGIEAAIGFCGHENMQQIVTANGAVWHLLLYIFKYDFTLEESGVEINEENHTQLFANRAAKAAFKCLCALAGFHPNADDVITRENADVIALLQTLLTPHVVRVMQFQANSEAMVLKALNSNSETPLFLWNNTCRAELRDFVGARSTVCRDRAGSADLPPMSTEGFEYSVLSQELLVGGVFIRIYNQQPTFPIEHPDQLFTDMVHHCNEADATPENIAMEGVAMKHLITAYPDVHAVAARMFDPLLQLLRVADAAAVHCVADLLVKCCTYMPCIEAMGIIRTAAADIALASALGDKVHLPLVQLAAAGLVDRNFAQQMLDRGLYVIVLHVFCTTRNGEAKDECCTCMAKAFSDKLSGPKMLLRAQKLMPLVFLECMKENATQVIQMFDTWQENPELVWNAQRKERVVSTLAGAVSNVRETMQGDRTAVWRIPEDTVVLGEGVDDLMVGGVYLSLFVKQPMWSVRKPREFLQALLEKFCEMCQKPHQDKEVLELVGDSTCKFINSQPSMADYIVALGYLSQIVKLLDHKSDDVVHYAALVLHEISVSRPCVESLANTADPIAALLKAHERLPDDIGVVMDTLERLVSRSNPERGNMLKLAMANQLVQKLLAMLEKGFAGTSTASSARAIIIKVIKGMLATDDPVYKPQIQHILDESAIWKKYKDQSHDLFLTSAAFGGFLTGPKQGPTLQITAGATSVGATGNMSANDDEPPPLD